MWTLETRGQVASITGSRRSAASLTTDCATPWALKTVTALSGISRDILDEDGALALQRVDDVAIVHDLVAHIDRLAELDQGAVDDVDRAHDAGAETAGLS